MIFNLNKKIKNRFQLPDKDSRGYIALMSAIIISILLIAITVGISFSGFFGRFNILDSESKERSIALAEACANTAIFNFAQNKLYSPNNECVSILTEDICPVNGINNACTIVSVIPEMTGGNTIIKTKAVINNSYSNLRITIDTFDFRISEWEECGNLTDSAIDC